MADRLTQLQDCLDDLATQMFASLRYVQTRHSYGEIEGQPDQNPFSVTDSQGPTATSTNGANTNGTSDPSQRQSQLASQANTTGLINDGGSEPTPDRPEAFQAALRELARDLILKEQQIEYIISVLPGIGTSERDQNARIKALEGELREVEGERKVAAQERDQMLDVLGRLVANCRRVH